MGSLFNLALPLILKLLGFGFDKYVENEEAEKQFLGLIDILEKNGLRSVKLSDSYRDQLEQQRKKKSAPTTKESQ